MEQVATKADLADLRTELKTDVAQVRTEVAQVRTEVAQVRTDLSKLETRLVKWMAGLVIGATLVGMGTVSSIVIAMLKFLG